MAKILIRLFRDAKGQLRNVVGVNPGDVVQWVSNAEDITVAFGAKKNPFSKNIRMPLKATAGNRTLPVQVKARVKSPRLFTCKITIGGKKFPNTVGVDTPGS